MTEELTPELHVTEGTAVTPMHYTYLRALLGARLDSADERGANLVEYILLVGLIVMVASTAIYFLGTTYRDQYVNRSTEFVSAGSVGG